MPPGADRVIPASQELKKEIIEYYHLDAEKINVIENPYDIVEIEKFANETIDKKTDEFIQNHKTAVAVEIGRAHV